MLVRMANREDPRPVWQATSVCNFRTFSVVPYFTLIHSKYFDGNVLF